MIRKGGSPERTLSSTFYPDATARVYPGIRVRNCQKKGPTFIVLSTDDSLFTQVYVIPPKKNKIGDFCFAENASSSFVSETTAKLRRMLVLFDICAPPKILTREPPNRALEPPFLRRRRRRTSKNRDQKRRHSFGNTRRRTSKNRDQKCRGTTNQKFSPVQLQSHLPARRWRSRQFARTQPTIPLMQRARPWVGSDAPVHTQQTAPLSRTGRGSRTASSTAGSSRCLRRRGGERGGGRGPDRWGRAASTWGARRGGGGGHLVMS